MIQTEKLGINDIFFLLKFDLKSIEESIKLNNKDITNHRINNAKEKLEALSLTISNK